MCIPIFVIYGSRTSMQPMGWTARMCGRCRRVQAFECFEKLQSSHVYYIYTKEKSIGSLLICDFCETAISLAPKSKEAKALILRARWQKKDGLQLLVDKTNPQLGQVPVSDTPTREELFAFLESLNERTNPFKITMSGGGLKDPLLGAALGAIAVMIVSLLLYAVGVPTGLDASLAAFHGILFGGIGGGAVGWMKTKFDYAADLAQEILIASMARNSISLPTIQRALKHYPKRLKYAAAGVDQLAAL